MNFEPNDTQCAIAYAEVGLIGLRFKEILGNNHTGTTVATLASLFDDLQILLMKFINSNRYYVGKHGDVQRVEILKEVLYKFEEDVTDYLNILTGDSITLWQFNNGVDEIIANEQEFWMSSLSRKVFKE